MLCSKLAHRATDNPNMSDDSFVTLSQLADLWKITQNEAEALRHSPTFPEPVTAVDDVEFFERSVVEAWRSWSNFSANIARTLADGTPDPNRPLDDEEVISWWEAYDKGDSPEYIAFAFERPVDMVTEHLDLLGAFEEDRHPRVERSGQPPTPEYTDGIPFDQDLIERALTGLLSSKERAIFEALGRMAGYDPDDHRPEYQGTPHVFVRTHSVRRAHRPMDSRERSQNNMASSVWRRAVAADMADLGIMPSHRKYRGKSEV